MKYLETLLIFGGSISFVGFLAYLLGHSDNQKLTKNKDLAQLSLTENVLANLLGIYSRCTYLLNLVTSFIKKEGFLIIVALLSLLIWMNRYEYYVDNPNFVRRINTITGSKCIIGSEIWKNRCKTGQDDE